VREKGGFEWSKMDEALGRFTKKVFLEIAPEVRYWVTINEPTNYTLAGYFTGAVPPGDARPLQRIVPVFRGILKAHAKMYQVLHLLGGRNLRVGMALQLREVQPGSYWNPLDVMLVHWVSETFNWSFPDAMTQGVLNMYIGFQLNVYERIPGLMGTQDFVGINYYGGDRVHYSLANGIERKDWDDLPDDQLDPDARPKAFYSFIKQVSKRYPKKPILILENGINDPDDSKRPQFIKSHLKYLSKAIQEGAPVIGYCHWSLMDNFEWLLGNSARFGLYETNYADYTRQPKRSALLFKNIAAQNGFQCD
jgi:beta-glucosidase